MHFDDKPLQQNSRGEYIAFVERAGRCPNGLRYFSAWSNKFDRIQKERERGRVNEESMNPLCLRNYSAVSEWSWSVGRLIDWLIDWLIDRCCNDVTEHRPSQRVETWGCVLDCDENWATACDGLQTFPLTGLIARSLVRLIASDWDVMMILWLLRNSECFGFFYIYIPVYDPSIISCSNFSFFNYLVYLKKKRKLEK